MALKEIIWNARRRESPSAPYTPSDRKNQKNKQKTGENFHKRLISATARIFRQAQGARFAQPAGRKAYAVKKVSRTRIQIIGIILISRIAKCMPEGRLRRAN